MQNKVLLSIGAVLIVIGLVKPDISNLFNTVNQNTVCSVESYVTDPPSDMELMSKAEVVAAILSESDDSTRPSDCLKLSALYSDMAQLISLDESEKVIRDTAAIRSANSLSGKMLRLNIKDKYPKLAEAAKDLLVYQLGEDDIILDNELRDKAVQAFRALSWAFYKGSK